MKLIKKMLNVFLITVMLFSEFAPYAVFADVNSNITVSGTKGQIYNPVTNEVNDTSVTVTETYDTGLENNQGDLLIQKTVTKVDGKEGEYKVKFEISGNKVTEVTNSSKPVYAVVVLDKSGSMKNVKGKWEAATSGATKFASTLISNIPTANIALVTFSGTKNDEDCIDWGFGGCKAYDGYNDATLVKGFANEDFSDVNFPSTPSGGTNLEAGLKLAKDLLDNKIEGNTVLSNAIKYVIVIGDGTPTYYYDELGLTAGPGNDSGDTSTSISHAKSMATSIKSPSGTNAKIYAIGYEVANGSTAEEVLKDIASPDETLANGNKKTYYYNADAEAVGKALTDIAKEIKESNAGKDATITDTIGGSFTISNANGNTVNGDKVSMSINEITSSFQTVGEFTIKIDPDSKTGWHDTNAGFTLTYTDANGVTHENIKFNNNPAVYWVQNEYDYKIEYYYENNSGEYVIDDSLTVDSSLTEDDDSAFKNSELTVSSNGNLVTVIKDSDNTFTFNRDANSKNGYEFVAYKDKDGKVLSDGKLIITNNTSDNIVKVYYKKIDLQYTVEHYLESDNGYTKVESDTLTKDIHYGETATYTSNAYTGYAYISSKDEFINNNQVVDSLVVTDNNLVIKLYYDKNEYNYVIRYHYEGISEYIEEGNSSEYNDTITVTQDMIDNHNKAGYVYSHMNPESGSIVIKTSNNIIDVYYVKGDFKYTVEYYYDGIKNDSKTENYTATYLDVIDTYIDKNITGYKFEKTENKPLTISENEQNNIIKVYYVKDTFGYSVEYYYDGIKNDSKTEKYTATYLDVINTYVDKNITGYKLEKTENKPLTISENDNDNVIKVYYVKDNFDYKVEHFLQNLDGTYTLDDTDNYLDAEYGSVASYEENVYTGYTYQPSKTINGNETVPGDNSLVIKLYYDRNSYNYKVEHFLQNLDGTYVLDTTDHYNGVLYGSNAIYEENVYTGYTYNEAKTINGNTTVPFNNDLVIELYYDRNLCTYRVEYYYDGTLNSDKTDEFNNIKYGTIITDYSDKNITGYKFVMDENKPLEVGLDKEENVIKVYYEKDTFAYTVEYYYDGTIDSTKTENYTATYLDVINGYVDKNITGYKLEKVENKPLTISANEQENVIKVYYVKDEFAYTVEYYYDGIKNDSKTENYTATYLDVINTYVDKNITGYKFEKVENKPLTISANESNNVIKVYYVKDEFGYTVEYYYDGTIDSTKTENYTATYLDVINSYVDKNITGYKLEKIENKPLTISENKDNNVIKVYYVKDEFAYTVEYYYDGTIDSTKTENYTATYLDVINSYVDKNITGYKFEKVENKPLTISANESNNVIKVYYVKDEFAYTVEYYYDGTIDSTKTENYTATYLDVINTYVDKNITGYKLEKVENKPLAISENKDNNVIKVYYVKDEFAYTVEYYYDGTIDSTKTENYTATYLDVINTYVDKNITGYKLEKVENKPLTISENKDNNVIKVYYVKDEFAYTVEYYYDGTIDSTKTENYTATYLDVINSYVDKNITGYKLEKVENKPLTISENEQNNIIKVYYVKDTFGYSVEYYYDGIKNDSKTEKYTATYLDVINTYVDKNITGYKLEKVENKPLTISENDNDNVIKVYYVKDNFDYKVEHYLQNLDGTYTLDDTDNYNDVEFDSVASYEVNVYTGYTYQPSKTINGNETVPANNDLVIKLYYDRNIYNYKVEHFLQNLDGTYVLDTTDHYNGVLYGSNAIYEENVYTGYTYNEAKTINGNTTVPFNNDLVIELYYDRNLCTYRVEYYYDGTLNSDKTDEFNNIKYGTIINDYSDKNITGYKFVMDENKPLEVGLDKEENVIKVYYEKDTFAYTVEYYYDGTIDSTKTENYTATYLDVINSYVDKNITGYKLEKVENKPLTISENEQNNVIKVYYVKDNFDYKVEHFLQNLDGTYTLYDTDNYNDVEFDSVANYEVNVYTGYTYNETKTINGNTTVPANNDLVIKLYYDRNIYSYIVNHYVENIDDNEYTLQDTDTYTKAIYGSQATYELNEYENCVYTSNEYIYANGDDFIIDEEIITNKLVPNNNNLVINVYYGRNLGKVTIHYVIKDVDDGSYIPFSVYGQDINGNNTEDFIGLDLNDLVIEGKIGSQFKATGRNPIEYKFIGLYEGDLKENNLISTNQEYSNTIDGEIELTFVYEAPYGGDVPPQTGVESNHAAYLTYILFIVMMTLTYSYIRACKKED